MHLHNTERCLVSNALKMPMENYHQFLSSTTKANVSCSWRGPVKAIPIRAQPECQSESVPLEGVCPSNASAQVQYNHGNKRVCMCISARGGHSNCNMSGCNWGQNAVTGSQQFLCCGHKVMGSPSIFFHQSDTQNKDCGCSIIMANR